MSLPPLAQVADVTDRLISTANINPTRIVSLLKDASAKVRAFTKQDFTVSQTTANVRPLGYRLKLVQRPIISIDNVAIRLQNNAGAISFPGWWWDGSSEVWLMDTNQIVNLSEELESVMAWQTPSYDVTYTHGYASIPDDVIGVVCSMVVRSLTVPNQGGVISESVGEYSYRLSDAAALGPMTLTKSEEDTLRSYKPRQKSTFELRG
jgi:hypothetical protein